jgi:hypothetical protein
VAYYAGNLSAGRAADADFAYLPSDATAVAYADVQDIMKSGFSHRVRALLPTGADKDRLTAEIGVDLERDIDSVMASMSGAGPEGGVVLLRGRFDLARIEALALQHGGSVGEYRGKKLLLAPDAHRQTDPSMGRGGGPGGPPAPGVACLETNLIALGAIPALHRAIDTATTHEDITGNPELMKFVGDVRSSNAWVVGRLDAVSATPGFPDELRAQLPSVQWVAVSADIDQAITGSLRALAVDAKAGDDLRKMINGAIAAARVFGGSNPTLLATLNSLQASGQGQEVEVSYTLTAEMVEQLHAGAAGAPGGGRGPDPTRMPPLLK